MILDPELGASDCYVEMTDFEVGRSDVTTGSRQFEETGFGVKYHFAQS